MSLSKIISNGQYSSLTIGSSSKWNYLSDYGYQNSAGDQYGYSYTYSDSSYSGFKNDSDALGVFKVSLTAGKSYNFETKGAYSEDSYYGYYGYYDSYDLQDTIVSVYDTYGNLVARNDDKEDSSYSSVTYSADVSGYYYVVVEGNGGSGYYNLISSTANSAPILSGTQKTFASVQTTKTLTISQADLLAGFKDLDGDTMSVSDVKVDSGTITKSGTTWTYTASSTAPSSGVANISYKVSDGKASINASNSFLVTKPSEPAAIKVSVLDSTTTEDGGTGKIKVYLTQNPDLGRGQKVTITLTTKDNTEGKFLDASGNKVDSISAVLTSSNYSSGVTVSVVGMQDYLNDGNASYDIKVSNATTDSSSYTDLVRDIKETTYSFINEGDKDSLGNDKDTPLYLIGDNGSPKKDVLIGNDGADRLYGGYMIDDLEGGLGADRLYGGYEDDYLYGDGGNDTLYGEQDDDFLYGNDGNDRLDGGIGADYMEGGAGDDTYYVTLSDDGAVEDTVVEALNGGKDTIYIPFQVESYVAPENVEVIRMNAGFGDTSVTGNKANNEIVANAGDNELDGGAGNDIIAGGLGSDSMIGGAGSDDFVFTKVKDTGATKATTDVIEDFGTGDQIDLSAIDANSALAGNQSFKFVTSLGGAGQVSFKDDYLYVSTDADASAEMVISIIGTDITSANFAQAVIA